jgi:hypothetical protein
MGIGLLLAAQAIGDAAWAREPGLGLGLIPGVTLGQANAVPLTPGFRLGSRTSYNDAIALGQDGQEAGLRYYLANEIVLLTWVPEWTVLNAGYKIQAVIPFGSTTLVRDAPVPKAARGTFTQSGIGNPKIQFVDLSWTLGDGFYASARRSGASNPPAPSATLRTAGRSRCRGHTSPIQSTKSPTTTPVTRWSSTRPS